MFRKPWMLCASATCTLGFVLIFISSALLKLIVRNNLVLTPEARIYPLWKQFPALVPTDIYLFNWTNPEEIYNKNVKPKFEQMGPYRFMMDVKKTNITWNSNGTVTFEPLRYWYYGGAYEDLQDKVTFINIMSVGAAHVARTWNYFVRKGLSFSLSQLAPGISLTQTVDELLFAGYPDRLMKIAKTFPFFASTDMPVMDRFGWFYERNGSDYTAGVYNVGTGKNSTFGRLYNWNFKPNSPFYTDKCGELDAGIGENFDASSLSKYIKIFSSDLCRAVVLQFAGEEEVDGVVGKKYVLGDYMLDNGTTYPETKCSCNGDCLPIGIFNVSSCRFGSPAFVSLPHFYQADPYYANLLEGTKADGNKHSFYVIVEPQTGFPLKIRIRLQINVLLHAVKDVKIYEHVPTVFMPMVWFDQQIDIPQELFITLKQVLNVPFVCVIIGIGIVIMGLAVLLVILLARQRKKQLNTIKKTGIVAQQELSLLRNNEASD